MRSRSIAALVITAVTFLLLLVWLFSFPFEEHKLLAAIPGRASIISFHDRPAERLRDLESSRLLRMAAGSNNGSSFSISRYERGIKMYFGREVVFARVPVFERPGQSVWVFSSWAGAANQLIRLGLACPFIEGLSAERFDDGSLYWQMGHGARALSFSVRGGVLFGVIGEGGHTLAEMAARIDAASPDGYSIIRSRIEKAHQAFPVSKDVAWIGALPSALSQNGECLLSIKENSEGAIIDFVVDKAIDAGRVSGDTPSVSPAVTPDILDMFFRSTWPTVAGFLSRPEAGATGSVMSFVDDVSGGGGRVFAGMLTEDFSGHIYNLKIPVLIAGIEVDPQVDVTQRVFELMDRLNAGGGLGVIPVKVPTEDKPIIVAGGSKMNFFGGIKQRPALVVDRGWLLVCSDMQSLLSLLNRNDAESGSGQAGWGQLISDDDCAIGGYVDFTDAEMAIRNIIAVYTLSLIADGEATEAKRKQLDRIRSVIESMADIGETVISISSRAAQTQGRILVRTDESGR